MRQKLIELPRKIDKSTITTGFDPLSEQFVEQIEQ